MIQDIEDWLKENKNAPIDELSKKFNLKYLGSGIHRDTYKKKGSREVIKVGINRHNLSEYSFWKALKGTEWQPLFAACHEISKDFKVMTQEYVYRTIPARYDTLIDSNSPSNWDDIRDELESIFQFIKRLVKNKTVIFDLHSDNIRITRTGDLKIIDYSTFLHPLPMFSDYNAEAMIKAANKLLRKFQRPIKFYMNQENKIILNLPNKIVKCEAIYG